MEKNVQDARHCLWQPMPSFPDLAMLNARLERRHLELWHEIPHGALPGSIADAPTEERAALLPMPPAFDGFVELSKRVSPTFLISFGPTRYSVPASFSNRPVSPRVYPERLVVAAEGWILCEHPRLIERSHHLPPRTIYDRRHYLAVIQRKPGALRNGATFVQVPPAFRHLQEHLRRRPGGDREMVDVLALVLHRDEQVVLTAVELALLARVPTKPPVLNILHRLICAKTHDKTPIDTPMALALNKEPRANVDLIGGPGTVKTHVAIALGVQAVERHRRKVRFFSIIELVTALEQEQAKGRACEIAKSPDRLKTRSPKAVCTSTPLSSTRWAIGRSPNPAASCCSI